MIRYGLMKILPFIDYISTSEVYAILCKSTPPPPPGIVNSPALLQRHVGDSELTIRELFSDVSSSECHVSVHFNQICFSQYET